MAGSSSNSRWQSLAVVLGALIVVLWWLDRPSSQPSRGRERERVDVSPRKRVEPSSPAARSRSQPRTETASASGTAPATAMPTAAPRSEPERALDAALASADPNERNRQFYALFQPLVQRDPDAALAYVRQMPRSPLYSPALFMLLDALSRRDVGHALDLAAELAKTQEDRAFYSALFDRLARENVQVALPHLARVPAGEARENALRALTDVWVRQDPTAALAWAEKLPDAAERNIALESTVNELADRDPLRAVEFAKKSLTGMAFERTVARALQRLTMSDPEKAAQLVTLLPPGDMQIFTAVSVARALGERNMEAALLWIRNLPVEYTQWIVLNNFLSSWAQKDMLAAARYVAEMPPGGGLDFAAQHMAMLMASKPQDAIMWAESLPTSAKEAAFVSIASAWAQRQPLEAVKWAASLPTEPLRTTALGGAFTYWQMVDAAGARAWLERADFPPEMKAKIRYRDR